MSMGKLAFQNFKASLKNYVSLIISLAFSILIFLNFQNIVYAGTLDSLGETTSKNVAVIIEVITIVLACFMFFFLWYATNVFLTKRKKEIGIYVFMGLSNQKIGKLYMIESTLIGVTALILGIGFGLLTTQLFQMILIAVSDVSVELDIKFTIEPLLITTLLYVLMYVFFIIKGYMNIIRSSILDMVSANRQNEYVEQKSLWLIIKAMLGIILLSLGFYLAIKDGGQEVMGNILIAVILVIVGIYFMFGGFLPFLFQRLAHKKGFLYKKQRNLWVNNVIFRIKKNYRTYAIVCVLMLCSVTALATGFAMKNRYDGIVHFRNTYTYQVSSNQDYLDSHLQQLIEKDNTMLYHNKISMLSIDPAKIDNVYIESSYGFVAYSQLKVLAQETNMEFDLPNPKDDEIVNVSQLYLLSLLTDESNISIGINGKKYHQIASTTLPYLGVFQEKISLYMVNDAEYQRLQSLGVEMYIYNYKIADIENFKASIDELETIVKENEQEQTAYLVMDPHDHEIEWVKILYSICIFMFMVFVLASGSILFMKLYNDAFEEKDRYQILNKLGIERKEIKKAVANELRFAYVTPLLLMTISSYFSVHALAKLMSTDLLLVNIMSVVIIYGFFFLCYRLSISIYLKNAGI